MICQTTGDLESCTVCEIPQNTYVNPCLCTYQVQNKPEGGEHLLLYIQPDYYSNIYNLWFNRDVCQTEPSFFITWMQSGCLCKSFVWLLFFIINNINCGVAQFSKVYCAGHMLEIQTSALTQSAMVQITCSLTHLLHSAPINTLPRLNHMLSFQQRIWCSST